MAYIGQGIKQGTFKVLDTSGNTYNGSNTTFNLGTQVGSAAQLLVSHDGVIQKAGTDYTLATGGTQITFSTAPASGASIFITEISGAVGGTVTPSDASVTSAKLSGNLETPGTLDVNGQELILDADGDTSITADTDDQIDFKVAGADDLKMTANAINVLSGTTLTIDSGATITNSGTANGFGALAGIDDQSSSNDDQITITDSEVAINEDSDNLDFRVESNAQTHAIYSKGATDQVGFGESAIEGRLNINGTSYDDNYIGLKSSDVAHGITGEVETDTYARFAKYTGGTGGLTIAGYTEDKIGVFIQGVVTNADTTHNSSAEAAVTVRANIKSGTSSANMSSNGNLFTVQSGGNARFIVDQEGDLFADVSGVSGYDHYDDAHLVRAFDLSHGKGVINSKFDKFVQYNHEKLADLGFVGRENDGKPNHFINVTGIQRLHNGAIWQQYEKHNQLLEAVYDLAKEAVGEEKANAILEKHDVKRLQ